MSLIDFDEKEFINSIVYNNNNNNFEIESILQEKYENEENLRKCPLCRK